MGKDHRENHTLATAFGARLSGKKRRILRARLEEVRNSVLTWGAEKDKNGKGYD